MAGEICDLSGRAGVGVLSQVAGAQQGCSVQRCLPLKVCPLKILLFTSGGFTLLFSSFAAANHQGVFIINKGISVALLVVGVVLIVWGINASESFSSDVSRVFTGSPTDEAVWLLIGGIVAAIVGLFGLLRGAKEN